MIEINNPNDLYNLILKQNLTVNQVNEILKKCLPKTAIFLKDHTPEIMVKLLKEYFEKDEKHIFLGIDLSVE